MKTKRDLAPTAHDLEVWKYAQEELFNYLYKGIAGWFQILGHRLIGRWSKSQKNKHVVEIGCGQGHHVLYSGHDYDNYIGLEIRYDFIQAFKGRDSSAKAINGDAFQMPFADQSIDCILSIYIFEHLKELEKCLVEVKRILKPEGSLFIGLPAEGGFLYRTGRNLTSKRYMEKKFGFNYDAIVKYEHVNDYPKVIEILKRVFPDFRKIFLPFPFLPTYHLNAVVCLNVKNKK
jgi:SAM-dependent methyltransferase